ncbi:MAG: plastocyanin/azurin family copper-binding protein [Halobacteriales archaeon]
MRRRQYLAAAAGLVSASIAGCSGGGNGDGGPDVVKTSEVSMTGSQFDPRNIQVTTGATVTWTNEDNTAHTVTAASENWSFDTEVSGGGSAEFTFEDSGVYDVYCRFHGSADLTGMSMKIAVGDATIEAPLGGDEQDPGGGY